MKNDPTWSTFKDKKGKVKEVAVEVVGIRGPGHESNMQHAHGKIEAAYADLKNEYKKPG